MELSDHLCECGCGQRTAIATITRRRDGHVRGRPYRFIQNHSERCKWPNTFWSRVQKSDGCWLWLGTLVKGYGQTSMHGKVVKAHRASYVLAFGEIPGGLCVCHTCDVPACVRPDHLFLGTQGDNAKDKVLKGRSMRGERGSHAKLTEKAVYYIRASFAKGEDALCLAKRFGVTRETVYHIVNGRTWKHLDPILSETLLHQKPSDR